jgi:hypothetical protein
MMFHKGIRSGCILLLLTGLGVFAPASQGVSQTPPASSKQEQPKVSLASRASFVGDETCSSCHREEGASYAHTAHHLTSQMPDEQSILGSFSEGANLLKISDPAPVIGDPGVSYKMERRGDGYFVTAITEINGQKQSRSERMDLVIGSGTRGQSYLYWSGDALFELPVSYWSDGRQWINSPGYRNGTPVFDRPASPRCLECHITYIDQIPSGSSVNRYNRASLVPGIGCEVCHGAGAEHVARHKAQPGPLRGDPIVNPTRLARDRQIDMCALCHNGALQTANVKAFAYKPGEPLNGHLKAPEDMNLHLDVHANQVGLLEASRCYRSSPEMTCSTCHDVHAPERTAASYSPKCLACHQVTSCGMEKKLGHRIADNCIDCHMPVEQTNAIVSETGDQVIRTNMRSHTIAVYPQQGQPFSQEKR